MARSTNKSPDEDAIGVLSSSWADDFFQQNEQQSYGASVLIEAGKTDRPDDQLLRTIFDNDAQARAFAQVLARARRFHVTAANEFCTFYMEARTSVKGMGRLQYLQAFTGSYDREAAARLWDSSKKKNSENSNTRPIGPGD